MGIPRGGSSPRTRGTRRAQSDENPLQRFIPAHAGNTTTTSTRADAGSVHPRARGEHRALNRGNVGSYGSSPRTRGTPRRAASFAPNARFIPAHAGNTVYIQNELLGISVHPRARGEHDTYTGGVTLGHGSSPRTRGTLATVRRYEQLQRFIPAHAGNTGI